MVTTFLDLGSHQKPCLYREMVIPLAAYLGVSMENVFANRMNWQWDDKTMHYY
jgi:hypothetical protein